MNVVFFGNLKEKEKERERGDLGITDHGYSKKKNKWGVVYTKI